MVALRPWATSQPVQQTRSLLLYYRTEIVYGGQGVEVIVFGNDSFSLRTNDSRWTTGGFPTVDWTDSSLDGWTSWGQKQSSGETLVIRFSMRRHTLAAVWAIERVMNSQPVGIGKNHCLLCSAGSLYLNRQHRNTLGFKRSILRASFQLSTCSPPWNWAQRSDCSSFSLSLQPEGPISI